MMNPYTNALKGLLYPFFLWCHCFRIIQSRSGYYGSVASLEIQNYNEITFHLRMAVQKESEKQTLIGM